MSFWTTHKVAAILNTAPTSSTQIIHTISTDSRKISKECLFVAIKGDAYDGHDFIGQAIEGGAVAILSEKSMQELNLPSKTSPALLEKVEFFQVPSTLTALRALAHAYRKSFSIPMIGVVGAVGKTTTKELISSILTGKFEHILKTEGSQNGFLGIPLTLLRLTPETEIAVIEIGIDDIGAMEQHLQLVEPTHMILTAIGPEHLHQLKTVEIAAEEELKALDYALLKREPIALNLSDPYVQKWAEKNRDRFESNKIHSYSLNPDHGADFTGTYTGDTLSVQTLYSKKSFKIPIPGEHHAHNLLAALTLCSFFKMEDEALQKGLATFKTAYGRTEIYTLKNKVEVIGDYYNSNPTSAAAAIKLLVQRSQGDTHVVFGDMLELGDAEERFHRELAKLINEAKITKVWLYGPRMKWLQNELEKNNYQTSRHFDTHAELSLQLKTALRPESAILVKGSRGMKMEAVLKSLLSEANS